MNILATEGIEAFDAVEIIRTKRDGHALSDAQIDWVIDAYTRGAVADEQMAALAMAVLLRGLIRGRARALDGRDDRLGRAARPLDGHAAHRRQALDRRRRRQDHAAAGAAGRRLRRGRAAAVRTRARPHRRHAGQARVDPGLARVACRTPTSSRQLNDVGAVVCAAGDELAPADRKLYALRDVTGTVESIPLIASLDHEQEDRRGLVALVLDVKVGTGAFMKDAERGARAGRRRWSALGTAHGVRTVALLTDMYTPLGRTAGNALEVAESVEVLAGGGPADVVELTLALAREMLGAAGHRRRDPADALRDGRAMDVWRRMIAAQGGDPDAALPVARETHVVTAPESGTLTRLDAFAVGVAAWRLGAGRARKEDAVSAGAGVVMLAKPGDAVQAGEPLLELHADDAARFDRAVDALDGAYDIGTPSTAPPRLVLDRIG